MEWNNIFSATLGGLLGVIIGSLLTYKLNLRFQNKVIKKQLKVEKITKMLNTIYDHKSNIKILQITYMVFIDNKLKYKDIREILNMCNEDNRLIQKELEINKIIFSDYNLRFEDLNKEFKIISDVISYETSSSEQYIEEYENYISEKLIKIRIDDYMDKLSYCIVRLQQEYKRGI